MTSRIIAESFRPTKDNVFVTELDQGVHMTRAGIIIPDDNMAGRGIRARWGKVWKIGPDVTDIKPGNWILIEHGRWTTGIDMELADETVRVWRIEWPKSALLASDVDPREYYSVSMPANR
jgi:co-chaperonin GroES (HSP10)